MSIEILELGSVPANETCIQVSKTQDYQKAMQKQCRVYANQIKRFMIEHKYNLEKMNMRIFAKAFEHEMGMYYEVVIKYPDNVEEACEAAYWLEENLPVVWDEQSKIELE